MELRSVEPKFDDCFSSTLPCKKKEEVGGEGDRTKSWGCLDLHVLKVGLCSEIFIFLRTLFELEGSCRPNLDLAPTFGVLALKTYGFVSSTDGS